MPKSTEPKSWGHAICPRHPDDRFCECGARVPRGSVPAEERVTKYSGATTCSRRALYVVGCRYVTGRRGRVTLTAGQAGVQGIERSAIGGFSVRCLDRAHAALTAHRLKRAGAWGSLALADITETVLVPSWVAWRIPETTVSG